MTKLLYQYACCCGRVLLEGGEWARLAGLPGYVQDIIMLVGNQRVTYPASHGLCPECRGELLSQMATAKEARRVLAEVEA